MRRPSMTVAASALAASMLAACIARPAPEAPAPGAAAGTHARARAPSTTAELERGRQVARTTCITCHSELPPPKLLAPPLAMVAMHYRSATRDSAEAVARLARWIAAPAAERSLLPPMAIARFGVMPPLALPDSQRRAVAVYVLSLQHAGMVPGAHWHHLEGGR